MQVQQAAEKQAINAAEGPERDPPASYQWPAGTTSGWENSSGNVRLYSFFLIACSNLVMFGIT